MRFTKLILSFIFLLMLSSASYASLFKIRVLGGIGYTFVTTDALDSATNPERNKFSYNFEVEGVFPFDDDNIFGFGFALGYMKVWEWKSSTQSAKLNNKNFRLFFEVSPSIVVFQVGLGFYSDKGSYNSNTDNPGIGLGAVIVGGVDIPITGILYIPIMLRMDIIRFFNYWTIGGKNMGKYAIPVSINAGITLKF